jgi:hypothetical protein
VGMHHGIIVAGADIARTVAALNRRKPQLVLGDGQGSLTTLNLEDEDDGWHMAVGELDGKTYILDTSMVLSTDPDAIVAMSADLATVVIGCGAETTSGTYWFFAADRGRLLRAYWNCYTDMQAPWSLGEPLPVEQEGSLEDLDGDGLLAALSGFGFDYDRWASGDDLHELTYSPADEPAADNELTRALEEFRLTVAIPEGTQPELKVVHRDGGYDIATVPAQKKGGILGFFRRN